MLPTFTIQQGHVLDMLKGMASESVHCVITSPPYWGLRDYGVAPILWDDNGGCGHVWLTRIVKAQSGGRGEASAKQITNEGSQQAQDGYESAFCHCGAWLGCYGLEPTPELYVSHTVQIFREIRRVLRSDGTLWLNLGDSYAGSWGNYGGQNRGNGSQREIVLGSQAPQKSYDGLEGWKPPTANSLSGLKPKDLCMIPARVAIALQADGWWLRSDIIWSKPNPMPESVTDRPTKSHEYIFLLSKSATYYYDHDAIKEPGSLNSHGGGSAETPRYYDDAHGSGSHKGLRDAKPARKTDKQRGHSRRHAGFNDRWDAMTTQEQCSGMRNKRSVWEIATHPFPEAHFATFPKSLVEICVKAGSKESDTVLDPFCGSGTTGLVALRLGRNFIGIELNTDYCTMARNRIINDAPLLNREAVA